MRVNAIVGQSGGPTCAINATLSGVIRGSAESKKIEKLYGMYNGIEGFLEEEIVDLSYLFSDEKALSTLELTPACALGSCRKRLPSISSNPEIYEKIISLFKKYNIRYFFYIGGNDSMDTAMKLMEYTSMCDYDFKVIGIPKTIDNDLDVTDHTPGFGSAAKYVATILKEIASDCRIYKKPSVTIVETMGRDAGWLTTAAGISKKLCGIGADLVYVPELPFSMEGFIEDVKKQLSTHPNVVVAVSEGVKLSDGTYVGQGVQSSTLDEFGNRYLAGTAKVLEQQVKSQIGCKTRSIELNLPQRCSSHISSATDIKESVMIGKMAVSCIENGNTGKMLCFARKEEYRVEIEMVDLHQVANKVKLVPRDYINSEGNHITDKCVTYITPLIIGETKNIYENGMPVHFNLRQEGKKYV